MCGSFLLYFQAKKEQLTQDQLFFRVYDITKGASPSYEEWGNGGRPLNLNKALDKKVQSSDELKNKFREQTLAYAQRRQKSKRGD